MYPYLNNSINNIMEFFGKYNYNWFNGKVKF